MACRMSARSSTPGRHTTARSTAPQVCSEGFLAPVLLRCYLGCRAFECGMTMLATTFQQHIQIPYDLVQPDIHSSLSTIRRSMLHWGDLLAAVHFAGHGLMLSARLA